MAELARRQHGVVSRRQLLVIGVSTSAIEHRVSVGALHPLHRGVYAVGHLALTRDGELLAAVMAFGSRTVVSHRTAAVLHGLLDPGPRLIHVTTASTGGGRRPGLQVHETRRLVTADTTRVHGVPTSSLARALVDVAGSVPTREFSRAFDAADRKQLIDPLALAGQLRRGRAGSAAVRARLTVYTERPPSTSELEALFVDLCAAHGVPAAVPQSSPLPRRVQRVDFCWPRERVVVEVDGREWHAIQTTWGEDHERDLRLRLAGYDPRRYTWRQLTQSPELVLADLRLALRRTPAPPRTPHPMN